MQSAQCLAHLISAASKHRLRKFQLDICRIEVTLAQRTLHFVCKLRIVELTGREVDRHLKTIHGPRPLTRLTAGFINCPFAHADQQTHFLGYWQKCTCWYDAHAIWLPAQQRLKAHDCARCRIDLWLVMQPQLIALDRLTKPALELKA